MLTNSGLRGLYDKGSDGPNWNDVRKTIIADLPVFAFIQGSTNVSIVDKMVKVMNIQILQIKQTLKYGVETIVYILTKILLMLNQVKKKSLE